MDPWKDPPGWRTELRWGIATSLAANRYGFAEPTAVTASQMGVGCVFYGVVSSQITFYLSARGRWK